ncbi:MAG: phosphatidylserine/phosphatidylglycerophosphate/cardiolipin synthase family protein, partial [Myxococcota bacterium]
MNSELATSTIERRSAAPAPGTAGLADDRAAAREAPSRLPVVPPRQPVGLRELLGLGQGEYPTGFAAALQPSRVRPPVAPTYLADPTTLRQAFDAIPGGGPARSRQLTGNVESWASTWDMLTRAERSIDSTYYIIERDIYGFAFLGQLLRKQRQGVRVRLMADATGDVTGARGFTREVAFTWPPQTGGGDYLQELAAAGSEVALYHQQRRRVLRVPESLVFGTSAVAAVNHDKIIVTDGQVGKTGGRNIANYYFADPADMPRAWHDGDAEVRGAEQARDLRTAFEREFHSDSAARVTPDPLGNWTRRDIELLGASHLMDLWMRDPPLSDAEQQALRGDASRRSAMAADLVERALVALRAEAVTRTPSRGERETLMRLANELVGYTRTRGSARTYDREERFFDAEVKIIDQTSAAVSHYNEIAPALTTIIRGAQRRIIIHNQYVVLTREMIDELARASSRGVEILFATNSPLSSDSTVTQAY